MKYGEIWRDMVRYIGELWRDMARYGEIWREIARDGEIGPGGADFPDSKAGQKRL